MSATKSYGQLVGGKNGKGGELELFDWLDDLPADQQVALINEWLAALQVEGRRRSMAHVTYILSGRK